MVLNMEETKLHSAPNNILNVIKYELVAAVSW